MKSEQRLLRKIGQALRKARMAQGLSQMALAAEAGLDKTYIGSIERAEVNPSVGTLNRLAKALNMTLIVDFAAAERR